MEWWVQTLPPLKRPNHLSICKRKPRWRNVVTTAVRGGEEKRGEDRREEEEIRGDERRKEE